MKDILYAFVLLIISGALLGIVQYYEYKNSLHIDYTGPCKSSTFLKPNEDINLHILTNCINEICNADINVTVFLPCNANETNTITKVNLTNNTLYLLVNFTGVPTKCFCPKTFCIRVNNIDRGEYKLRYIMYSNNKRYAYLLRELNIK